MAEYKPLKHDELPYHKTLTKHGYEHTGSEKGSQVRHKGPGSSLISQHLHKYTHPSGDTVTVNHHYHHEGNAVEITHAGVNKHGQTHVGKNQTANWVHSPHDYADP